MADGRTKTGLLYEEVKAVWSLIIDTLINDTLNLQDYAQRKRAIKPILCPELYDTIYGIKN